MFLTSQVSLRHHLWSSQHLTDCLLLITHTKIWNIYRGYYQLLAYYSLTLESRQYYVYILAQNNLNNCKLYYSMQGLDINASIWSKYIL